MPFGLQSRVALTAAGRVCVPAMWIVANGRTVSLQQATREGERASQGVAPAAAVSGIVDGVLLPGLVNAHSHLDLAGVPALQAHEPFTDWLLAVGGVRGDGRDVRLSACRQAATLAERGVTVVGDIDASSGEATLGRRQTPLGGVSFLEIVGVRPESARARLAQSLEAADRLGGGARAIGLSPHAPYSVHMDVLVEIARAARARGLRLAMHLAETSDETRYLLRGDGPFEDFLRAIGRGRPFDVPPRLRPIAYAEQAGLLAAGCLVIHGNDLDDDDIARLARRHSSVVYCHGTQRHFGRPPHRIGELLAAGVNVALGTDSGLSNVGIDLLAEVRRLYADRPDIDPLQLLRCATLGGRVALAHDPGAADFLPGSTADAVVLTPAPAEAERMTARELAEWVLSDSAGVAVTVHAGRPSAPPCSTVAPPAWLTAFLDTVGGQG